MKAYDWFEKYIKACNDHFSDEDYFDAHCKPEFLFDTMRGDYLVAEYKAGNLKINFGIFMSTTNERDVFVEIILHDGFRFPTGRIDYYEIYYFIESLVYTLLYMYVDIFEGNNGLSPDDRLRTYIRGYDSSPQVRDFMDIVNLLEKLYSS